MIRALQSSDYRAVKALFIDVFQMSEDDAFVRAWKRREPDMSWAYVVQGSVIGAAIVVVHKQGPKLEYLFVSEAFQHQGIGTALLDAAVERVFQDYDCLALVPAVDNDPLVSWYQRNGFEWAKPKQRLLVRYRSLRKSSRCVFM